VIDPVLSKVDRDVAVLNQLGLRAVVAANTHVHADHMSGSFALRVKVPGCRSAIAAAAGAAADVCLADGDALPFGTRALRVIATPGHTQGCISFSLDTGGAVFTGDTLLVRGCGRTDFQGGSSAALFTSVRDRLFALPPTTRVFPGHDYNGHTETTIGEEARFNPRLGALRSAADFDGIMAALNLPRPAAIDTAVPANVWDGDAERAARMGAAGAMPAAEPVAVMEAGSGLPSQCKRCADAIEDGKSAAAAAKPAH
jgi:glyoxylase-like metal-dependent hydrolase (beta-lactamase superfamily II)